MELFKHLKIIIKYFGVALCLLILVSVLSCVKRTEPDCRSKKVELLLEDLLKKKYYFYAYKHIFDSLNPKIEIPPDSSMYFGYLITGNLNIPNKKYYLLWGNELKPPYPDSVELRVIKDISEMGAYAYSVGVSIIKANEDSTKMKVVLGYGFAKYSLEEVTFTYLFDVKNCKWTVLDSTIWQY